MTSRKAKKPKKPKASPNAVIGTPFKVGNPGGPGNPFASKLMALKVAMYDAVGTADLEKLIKKHLRQGIAGNTDSARLILDRLLGKPKETIEVKVGVFGILAEVKTMAEAARLTMIDVPAVPILPEPKVNGKPSDRNGKPH